MNKNVLICIPSFDQKIHLQTISSIINTRDTLLQAKIGIGMMWVRDSLITRGRNKLVTEFLKGDYTHLFFIDADISFTPDDFIRVLNLNKPVSTAPYPLKNDKKIEDGDSGLGWCVNFPLGKYDFKDNDNGYKLCDYAGTGFMCIQKDVFKTILKKYPQIEYLTEVNVEKKTGIKEYAFFDCGIQGQGILEDKDNTRRYLSEDFYFCALWQQCGGEIWTDITSELKHIGIKTYERKPIAKRSYKK